MQLATTCLKAIVGSQRLAVLLFLSVAVASCGNEDPPPRQGCEAAACHGASGTAKGIEIAHAGQFLFCTDCHGGDGESVDKTVAHVLPAPQWVADRGGYLKNLSVNELDAVDSNYMRFVNPGDYRVATIGCGSESPRANGGACHQKQVDGSQRSVMATFVGHFNVPRFQAGMQPREALFGSTAIVDPDFDPTIRGTVASLTQAVLPPPSAPKDSIETAIDHYLPKNCTHCHQWSYGRNDARGNFRSSGCTSCHMVYNNDGISLSNDPTSPREQPPHPERHEITVDIPEDQCEHCHYQGARIGMLYQGIIEWGFPETPPFPNIGESLHNHPPEFYLDAKSDPAHPADLHYEAGMSCADCHVGRDVHGDGRIYSTAKFQVAVTCENCHGNIDQVLVEGQSVAPLTLTGTSEDCQVTPDESGHFRNCAGDPMKRLYRRADNSVWLRTTAGTELRVSQIKEMLDSKVSENMMAAMGRDPNTGRSHTEIIECDGCHTAYRQYCFGCHVTMDYSQEKTDLLTGMRTHGAEVTSRQGQSLDLYFLGENRRGKLRSFCPSMQVFVSAIDKDENGDYFDLFRDRARTSAGGKTGFNWGVDMPHVTSAIPQNCSRCHADEQNACDQTIARQSYGYGTGRFTYTDENNTTYDLTQLLDSAGEPMVDFSHEGQGPVEKTMRERALSICVEDQLR